MKTSSVFAQVRTEADTIRLTLLPPEEAVTRAVKLLEQLTSDPALMQQWANDALARLTETQEPIANLPIAQLDGACSLEVFAWATNAETEIHPHASWTTFRLITGSLVEDRYAAPSEAAGDESAPGRWLWRRVWFDRSDASTLLPHEASRHRLANRGAHPAISLHLYGPVDHPQNNNHRGSLTEHLFGQRRLP